MYKVFAAFLALRILSVFVVKSWYVPDEYWQSLEVGHKLAFGYGYLTWEWTKGIRSYIYPLCIGALYRALAWFDLDQVNCLVFGPRILQAILSAISDYCFFRWSNNSKWSIFLITTSWFWFYTASRTLSNTIETCLTTIALRLYPKYRSSDSHGFLWIVALLCFVRPTAAILWLPLCIYHVHKSIHSVFELLIKRYLLIGLIVGGIAITLDSYAHGYFIVTPLEFFKANILENVGSFYGTQPWYWYFTTGLPTILGLYTIPFIFAIIQTVQNREIYQERYILLQTILFTLSIYSLLTHKEFRFILPLLPICLFITSDALSKWSRNASRVTIWLVAIALLISNAIPALYLSLVHQRGTTDVMHTIERIAREYKDQDGHRAKLLFLMPCHSTPWYSHVHQNVTMRFLTCEPNLKEQQHYLDEADQFYVNPSSWLQSHIPVYPKTAMPTHTILFDTLQSQIDGFLKSYQLIANISHSEYINDRIGHNVLVFQRTVEPKKKKEQKLDDFQTIDDNNLSQE